MLPGGPGDAAGVGRRGALEGVLGPGLEAGTGPLAVVGFVGIADEAVDPEVGDADAEAVLPCFEGVGHIDAEGGLPECAEGLAVEGGFGDHLDVAEIERGVEAGFETVGGQAEDELVDGGAGEVSHAILFVVGERDESGQGDLGGGTEIGGEADEPWSSQGNVGRRRRDGELLRLAVGILQGNLAWFPGGEAEGVIGDGELAGRPGGGLPEGEFEHAILADGDGVDRAIHGVFHAELLGDVDSGIACQFVRGLDCQLPVADLFAEHLGDIARLVVPGRLDAAFRDVAVDRPADDQLAGLSLGRQAESLILVHSSLEGLAVELVFDDHLLPDLGGGVASEGITGDDLQLVVLDALPEEGGHIHHAIHARAGQHAVDGPSDL